MPWSRSLAVGRHSWPTNIWFDAACCKASTATRQHQAYLVAVRIAKKAMDEILFARYFGTPPVCVKAGELRMCFPTPTTVRVLPWSNHIPPDHLGQEAIPGANNGSGDQTAH
ncbi:unnamed protein product [Fusarium fujikuroi]|uniref:Uncharacterized protein n=1 Tax=Fusarium fujikuroi TaxID=5127 RepID=A0A9Q9RWU2_FUSFU|nr:unnamed protein product [Fusarium fujikuroi]VTT78679.1 unnamed protein product [Fusarium fujikuroi]VZH87973.1 unnamed protein product [Fusarium fujikuroi]